MTAAPTDRPGPSTGERARPARLEPAVAERRPGLDGDDAGGEALDHLIDALRDFPRLSTEEASALAKQIRDEERVFREEIFAIPATAALVVERWLERRRRGLATGALSTHFREGAGTDWSAVVDERLEALVAVLEAESGAANDEARARCLASAELRLELLEELATEQRELLDATAASPVERRRRALGLDAPGVRERLARAEQALKRRRAARRRFAAHNLRFVIHVAKRFRGLGVAFLDLIQEGSIGLLRAVDRFDPDRGFQFSSYAIWWIKQSILRAIQRDARTVRLPSHVYDAQLRYRSAEARLRSQLSREPHRSDLADDLGVTEKQIERLAASLKPIASLESPSDDPDLPALVERLPSGGTVEPGEFLDAERMRSALRSGLARLAPRERDVLSWRFGLRDEGELTLQEVGDRLGVSKERVRQIQNAALKKLRSERRLGEVRELVTGERSATANGGNSDEHR